jgi:hypothetical protein
MTPKLTIVAFFVVFFGGLSLPITQSFINHLFSMNMR